MEKSFYDQQIDSDIKRYVEMRKSALSQSEGYTDGFCQIMIISKIVIN